MKIINITLNTLKLLETLSPAELYTSTSMVTISVETSLTFIVSQFENGRSMDLPNDSPVGRFESHGLILQ